MVLMPRARPILAEYTKSTSQLWATIFEDLEAEAEQAGHGERPDVGEVRGMTQLQALQDYVTLFGADAAHRLVASYDEVRTLAVANCEALRKLVKKSDKKRASKAGVGKAGEGKVGMLATTPESAPAGSDPSGASARLASSQSVRLLPHLYASVLASAVCSDGSPFELLREALAKHEQQADGEVSDDGLFHADDHNDHLPAAVHARATPAAWVRWVSYLPGARLAVSLATESYVGRLVSSSVLGGVLEPVLTPLREATRPLPPKLDAAPTHALGDEADGHRMARNESDAHRLHEAGMLGRRASELAWLRETVAHEIPRDDLVHLVAHRGFHSTKDRSDRRPIENSLEAYETAWTSGIRLCECDVAVTADDKLVLSHDTNYSRLALKVPGSSSIDRPVGELTLAQLMATPLKSGSRPPLLVDVLRSAHQIGNGAQLVIEIKPGNTAASAALCRVFAAHPELLPQVAVVMSFDLFIMHEFQAALESLQRGNRLPRSLSNTSSLASASRTNLASLTEALSASRLSSSRLSHASHHASTTNLPRPPSASSSLATPTATATATATVARPHCTRLSC